MTKSENKNEVEMHGCIVCARVFNILVVHSPDGRLVDCTVTSPGGHRVWDEHRPLVACDTHTIEEIEAGYKRWRSGWAKNHKMNKKTKKTVSNGF
jgi:hypothetical protein